jgi:hypothetical protein
MSCCGQRRQNWRDWATHATPLPAPPPALQNPRVLYHLGDASLLVQGAATGIAYLFGPSGSALEVDERDIATLVASGKFSVRLRGNDAPP